MRINASSNLTSADVEAAAVAARKRGQDIYVSESATSPRGAVTFYCEANHGRYAVNRPNGRGITGRAASWSAYGWLIAELYVRDPAARVGQYKSAADFVDQCQTAHERYLLRAELFSVREGEAGQDISFLDIL